MATFLFGLHFVVIISICCAISNVWSVSNQEKDVMQELVDRIQRIEAIQRVQQTELATQKRIIEEQANTIADLEIRCSIKYAEEKSVDIANKDAPFKAMSASLNTTDNTSAGQEDVVTKYIETSTAESKRQGIYTRQSPENGVSFSVYLDHDVELGFQQTLKFNKVITNEGDAYSIHTGVFTCPTAGVYMFAFYIGQRHENGAGVKLMVNSINMVDAVVETFHPNQDLQGGNLVIKRLAQGDAVWIELQGGHHIEGTVSYRFTTFSGAILYY